MRLPPDPNFERQRKRFELRFTCEDCAMFDPQHARCAHGYPTDEHRSDRYRRADVALVFCKDFDLM